MLFLNFAQTKAKIFLRRFGFRYWKLNVSNKQQPIYFLKTNIAQSKKQFAVILLNV